MKTKTLDTLQRLATLTCVSLASFIGGKFYESRRHIDDFVGLEVSYQNMPQVGPVGTYISLSARMGGKSLAIKDIGYLAEKFNPKNAPSGEEQLRQYEACMTEQFYQHAGLGRIYSVNFDRETEELEYILEGGVLFDVNAEYWEDGGELGDWTSNSFKITPKRR